MTTVNPVCVVNNVPQQPVKENSQKASFKGAVQTSQSNDSNLLDAGVKVGLAIAAAAGIVMAIKNGKAASEATEKLTSLTKKFDDLQKASGEAIDKLTKHERLSAVSELYKKAFPNFKANKLMYENGKVKMTEGTLSLVHEFDENNKLVKMIIDGEIERNKVSSVMEKDDLKIHLSLLDYKELLDKKDFKEVAENLNLINNVTKEQFAEYSKKIPGIGFDPDLKNGADQILANWPEARRCA